MPKLMVETPNTVNTNHGFSYSHIGVDKLEASNYTIVHIVTDKSSSVCGFENELEDINKTCVESCQNSPESENLLIRSTLFSSIWNNVSIEELHGYTLLSAIVPDQYKGTIVPEGATPLYDATLDALESLKDFGEKLYNEQHLCNAILFVITDGCENTSNNKDVSMVKDIMNKLHRNEELESFTSILIGVNTKESEVKQFLNEYEKDGGFDQYIAIDDANPKTLAKLAKFVSQSVSSTSQSLGSGGASQPLNFNSLTI